MEIKRGIFRFAVGGATYVGLELLWRGRSHSSMFAAGGVCFLLLGRLGRTGFSLPLKAVMGAGAITAVELGVGLVANRKHQVWDYRHMPLNYKGQICLPYSLLWLPVSMMAMGLDRFLEKGKGGH